jgi:hypothetical protein
VSIRRAATAATVLIGTAVPLLAVSVTAAAAPGVTGSLCNPPADTVGPVVTQVTFGQPTIDLNTGSRAQTVTVTASDTSGSGDPSGVAAVSLFIRGNGFGASPKLTLTSGTPASGDWTGQFVVSKYAHPGTYSIDEIEVSDAAGNEQTYPGYGNTPESPNALSLHPADDPTFTVTGTPAKRPHKHSGKLSSFTFTPTDVNTKSSTENVRVVATFTGPAPQRVTAQFYSRHRTKKVRSAYLNVRLHLHQKWTGSLLVPRWLGKQVVEANLFVSYGRGYSPSGRGYNADQLHHLHFPTKLTIVSGIDTTPPTLMSLSLSPDPIDSTNGAEEVTVTATATDARSGVRSVYVSGGIRHGANGSALGDYPFGALGVGYISSEDFRVRLKKTANGDWVGTTKVRRCVPSGTYKLSVSTEDVAGNGHYYPTNALAKAGITSTVDVTSKHGDRADPYIYSAATYGADSNLFLDFSEGVKNVSTSTLTIFALSPKSSRYTTTVNVADIVCANGKVVVDCSGSGDLVTSAKITVPDLEPGKKYVVYANLNQVTSQLTDVNGNAMQWNDAQTEVIGA